MISRAARECRCWSSWDNGKRGRPRLNSGLRLESKGLRASGRPPLPIARSGPIVQLRLDSSDISLGQRSKSPLWIQPGSYSQSMAQQWRFDPYAGRQNRRISAESFRPVSSVLAYGHSGRLTTRIVRWPPWRSRPRGCSPSRWPSCQESAPGSYASETRKTSR